MSYEPGPMPPLDPSQQPFAGHAYPEQSYPGQQPFAQPGYPGQPYPGQQPFAQHPYPQQPYPGQQPFAGQAYPQQAYQVPQVYPNPPQYSSTQAPPAKKKSKAGWVLGGIGAFTLLLCGLGAIGAASGSSTSTTGDSSVSGTQAKSANAAKNGDAPVGSTVSDGDVHYKVDGMDCSQTEVGSQYLNEKAQGKFCIVTVTVRNAGDSAYTFDGSDATAYDANGTQYDHDGTAEMYANDDASTFLEKINPGNQITAKVIFDVPQSTGLAGIEFKSGLFSSGARVKLA